MGLGKTLQSIGVILSNPPTGVESYPIKKPKGGDFKYPRCTIIVAPVSVMANWQMEIDKFVHAKEKNILKVAIYQGSRRDRTLDKVQHASLDVLICSYQTLAADFKMYKKKEEEMKEKMDSSNVEDSMETYDDFYSIFDVLFHRIILDEAHNIRNASTGVFKAAKKLQSMHKLALTGTPFVNHPKDIHSLLSFLEVEPLDTVDNYNHFVVDPILQRKEVGLARLRVVIGALAIRRTKQGKIPCSRLIFKF